MKQVHVAELTPNQINYAVGLAEVQKGLFTMDPRRAGFPSSLAHHASDKFKQEYPDLDVSPAPAFLQDRNGVMHLWGGGYWMVGTFDTEFDAPHIGHGPGGTYEPLTFGVHILGREKITTTPGRRGNPSGWTAWSIHSEDDESEGETLLAAGLRCYVHSVFGDTVELPDNVD